MFSTLLKLPLKQNFKGLTTLGSRSFAAGKKDQHKVDKDTVVHHPKNTNAESAKSNPESYEVGPTVKGDIHKIPKLTDVAHLNYRNYPNVEHNDPQSSKYIHSERDENADSTRIKAYNYIIERLKSDIEMQADVYQIIEGLDRPYKRAVPGVNRSISGGVRDYYPLEDIGFQRLRENDEQKFFEEHYNNLNRWENQTVFYPKFSPIKSYYEWQTEYENRPVTSHFHPDKGYKYDVITPWEKKHPHVADRFGYPEILGTPFERLMRLEGEIYHPTYLDQPFIQTPTADPHESLNFEEGEVIYENSQLLEWAKFWNFSAWSLYGFCALFVPYSLIFKTHMPLSHAYDNLFVPYYTQTMYLVDNFALTGPLSGLFAMYSSYLAVGLANAFWKDYVIKLQYSKDKELVFVTRISPFCSTVEEVYEVQHLEALPPSVKAAVADLSSQDTDGLWDVTCLASHRNLVLYNQDQYWNPAQRKDFFDRVFNLWTPDVIQPSRLDYMREAEFGPKINIGPEEGQGKVEKLEGK